MVVTKSKSMTAVVLMVVALIGGAGLIYSTAAQPPASTEPRNENDKGDVVAQP